jgi:hypothetical protein
MEEIKMRYRIFFLCIFFLSSLNCGKNTAEIAKKFGFVYDRDQDIFISEVDSWQRKAGYSSLVDLVSVPASMVIHCEPVKFSYKGKPYMIELWKGQYGVSTGAEIGIYKKNNPARKDWICGGKEDMLKMSYVLKKNGKTVFQREGLHWWLTGFKPGEYSEPDELTMDISISFGTHTEMLKAFAKRMKKMGHKISTKGDTISFFFDRPKSKQPLTFRSSLAKNTQKRNKKLVTLYNNAKTDTKVDDNSPESIDKIIRKAPELVLKLNTYKFN